MSRPDAAEQIEVARRRSQAIALRSQGRTWAAIADELGYSDKGAACKDVTRALDAERRELAETADLHRAEQVELLDELTRRAFEILDKDHLTVSHGRVVRLGQPYVTEQGIAEIDQNAGAPVLDDGPKLAAIDRLLRIAERRAKLLGLDLPVKQAIEHTGSVNYLINGVDVSRLT
ncbi:hypothetical protein [Amycolatopsis vancoresmycina]|uniref:hypothetical protein n=1 Tax=Amycolatopsis vancoresmycina TaxID=208444 RepID=UPI00052431D8|nr:hypothetical protein [Amycolatopsis vancoresmycina]